MNNFIPKFKAWQIFIFLILPIFFPKSLIGEILLLIWAIALVLWILNLGEFLHERLNKKFILSIALFRFNLVYAFLYLAIVSLVTDGGYEINENNIGEYGWTAALIIPLHFYLMYAMIYIAYFIAKALGSIKEDKEVHFLSYLGYFFLLIFLPLGIWWLQPEIRKLH